MPKISFEAKIGGMKSNRQLPYLTDYLSQSAKIGPSMTTNVMVGFIATVIGMVGIQAGLQTVIAWYFALTINIILLPLLIGGVSGLLGLLRRPRNAKERRAIDVRAAREVMRQLIPRRKLAKSLGSAISALLEESARNWNRAMASLNGPFWLDDNLPAHWKEVREQAIESLNAGMDDLVLIGKQAMQPVSGKSDWGEAVGAFVGGMLGVNIDETPEPLPPGFEPARIIAQKIQQLAGEVESATTRVFQEQSESSPFPSATSLDRTLGEFKSVHQAEDELRQNLDQSS